MRVINGGTVTLHNTTGVPYSICRTRELDMLRDLYELVRDGGFGLDDQIARMEEAEADGWLDPIEWTLDDLPWPIAQPSEDGGRPRAGGGAFARRGRALCGPGGA